MSCSDVALLVGADHAGWVLAAPFRAWLMHLADSTGLEPLTIAVAARVPTGVARTLADGWPRPRRIRAVDAISLLMLDADALRSQAQALADARPACQALRYLGPLLPAADTLQTRLGVPPDVVAGLVDGWLDVCPNVVVWKTIALAQDIMHRYTRAACRGEVIVGPWPALEDVDDFDVADALAA